MSPDAAASTGGNDGAERRLSGARRARIVRWLALCSPLLVPWVVVRTTGTTLVFPWGMLWLEGGSVVTLPQYLGETTGLPRHLRMWPIGTLCYGLALAWTAGRRFGADRRVAAGLLALSGIAAAWTASGTSVGPNRTALPVGTVHLLALAVWLYVSPVRDGASKPGGGDASDSRGSESNSRRSDDSASRRTESDSRRADADSRRSEGSDPARGRP